MASPAIIAEISADDDAALYHHDTVTHTGYTHHNYNYIPHIHTYLGMYNILSATTKPTLTNKFEAGKYGTISNINAMVTT